MNIAVVGLGLIGGSIAKAAKQNTEHRILGMDINESVRLKAKLLDAIDEVCTTDDLPNCDMVILALHPRAAEEWLQQSAARLKEGSLVVDCCGTKRKICQIGFELAEKYRFHFIGGHPMAGIERSGFDASSGKLFSKASMILTPEQNCDIRQLEFAKRFFLSLGFARITLSTPEEHDRIIAYTSQLAHVVSSSYMKSPTAFSHTGFSAGSFRDMTRVARLHEGMWTELFLENREFLAAEIDRLVLQLQRYREAITEQREDDLRILLKEGRELKHKIDELS
ncbi:MAG: prephenate dehydrogenase [Lentisphaerae bacterium]|jgi:prephenate dehydrogenase|nr:prephenate dehydrogenase [Lentisphaerota bacterium]